MPVLHHQHVVNVQLLLGEINISPPQRRAFVDAHASQEVQPQHHEVQVPVTSSMQICAITCSNSAFVQNGTLLLALGIALTASTHCWTGTASAPHGQGTCGSSRTPNQHSLASSPHRRLFIREQPRAEVLHVGDIDIAQQLVAKAGDTDIKAAITDSKGAFLHVGFVRWDIRVFMNWR
jgi:hypothetical protein